MQAYHTGVFGSSGGGKTTLLREMHDEYPGPSFFISADGADPGAPGVQVSSKQEALNVMASKGQWDAIRIVWRVTPGDGAKRALRVVRNLCHRIYSKASVPTQVIVDEAHNVMADGEVESDNPVKQMLHEDRDNALKCVVASQDPQDLEYGPLKQCTRYVWVGEWSAFHRGFIEGSVFRMKEPYNLPERPYQYFTFDRRMKKIEEGETSEQYA